MKTYLSCTITFLLLFSFPCEACKCRNPDLSPEYYFSYDIIFSGTLDTIVEKDSWENRKITFFVQTMYKGDSSLKFTFKNINKGSCWGSYKKGLTYLIYLKFNDKEHKTYFTTTCRSRNVKPKADYLDIQSKSDTSLIQGGFRYIELDFLEKMKNVKNGMIEIQIPGKDGKIYIKGMITDCLPTGIWTICKFECNNPETVNYKKGRKFRKKIICK